MLPASGDDVTITGNSTIQLDASAGTVQIRSLTSTPPITISNGSLTLSAASSIQGELTVSGSSSVLSAGPQTNPLTDDFVIQNGAQVSFPNVTDVSDITQITVDGTGSKLSFPNATGCTSPNDTSVSWTASNSGELDFPALTSITGAQRTQQYSASELGIRADSSGVINFNSLTTISQPAATMTTGNGNNQIYLDADNSGQINAPLLNTFRDLNTVALSGSSPASNLVAYSSGVLSLPELLAPVGIQINVNALSHPDQFTSLVGTYSLELNDGTAAMQVNDISGLTNIQANGNNVKLLFPNVQSYTAPNDTTAHWEATDSAELDFPSLTSITGAQRTQQYSTAELGIRADNSGVINFTSLTTISQPAATMTTGNGNNQIDLDADNSGQINAPLLNTFQDLNTVALSGSSPASNLLAYSSGVLMLPKLLAPVGIQININALSHPEQFTSLAGTYSFQLSDGVVSMALNDITGLTFIYVQGANTKLTFPNVTNFTAPNDTSIQWHVEYNGELDFPALTTITGPLRTQAYNSNSLNLRADDSGVMNLPVLTTITEPAATVSTANANNSVNLDADNLGQINAPLLNTFDDFGVVNQSGVGPASSLTAYNSGVLSIPELLAPVGIQIALNDLSHPDQFTSLVGTTSFQVNGGTVALHVHDISGLASIYVQGNNSKLSFPNVTNFTVPNDTNIQWHVEYSGELDFPALTTITGPLRTQADNSYSLNVRADNSGVMNFPVLTTITEPAATVSTANTNNGVNLDADNLGQISAPLLNTFDDFGVVNQSGAGPASGLTAYNSGVLSFPKLLAPVGIQMNLNDLSHPELFTSLVRTSNFELNSGVVAMQIQDLSGIASIYVTNANTRLSFPNVTDLTVPNDTSISWQVEYNGELDFPALTTISGPLRTQESSSHSLNVRAENSGVIDFAALTTITEPAPTVPTDNSNNGVNLDADRSLPHCSTLSTTLAR